MTSAGIAGYEGPETEMASRQRLMLKGGASMGSGIQAIGAVATTVYTVLVSFALLEAVDAAIGLRVSGEEESGGLDLALHDEVGYNL